MAVTAADAVASAALLVIKVGSSLLVDGVTGQANAAWLATLAADIAQIRGEGRRVIVVSSGAVALGRARLGLARRTRPRLDEQQAAAAAGQSRLMRAWEEALEPHGLVAAQLLLTAEDTENRTRWLNARATVETLLAAGAVPVVNENDTVATDEIRYGDNDRLAARVAQLAQADTLLLLSDVDGLYTADPRADPAAEHLAVVDSLTPEVMAMGGGPNAEAQVGSGGMATKLQAAAIARSAGCATVITLGSRANPVSAVAAGERATLVTAGAGPLAAYKQWIAGALKPKGVLTVDQGAAAALLDGRSLLPSGVSAVDGAFRKGDCVLVRDRTGADIAMGLVNFSHAEVVRILGRRTEELEPLLGYRTRSEVVHRDDLVEFSGQSRRAS